MTTKLDDVIWVGYARDVVAMNKRTCEICWTWQGSKGSGYATLMLEGGLLIVSGWMWAVDAVAAAAGAA